MSKYGFLVLGSSGLQHQFSNAADVEFRYHRLGKNDDVMEFQKQVNTKSGGKSAYNYNACGRNWMKSGSKSRED